MIVIKDNKNFLSVLNLIKNIREEVDITFFPEKIYVRAVHLSNSNALIIEINKLFFKEYKIDKEMTYTVSLENFIKIIRLCKKETTINLKDDCVEFTSGKSQFNLNYYIGNKDERQKPVLEHTVNFNINSKKFYDYITDCISIDTICEIDIDESGVYFISKSHQTKSKIELEDLNIIKKDDLKVFFDLELLNLSVGLKDIFSNITVNLGNDLPLTINCENDLIKCEFILAIRCED